MFLRRIELQGFKSFAHKTALDFSKNVVAIVGPNGSGKSNISDAIRWCLGEQSSKLLRGKRSHDVIFSGSDVKTRLGFAEVSLLFDNRKKIFPLENPEVEITRRIHGDGESEFFVNRRPVRLHEMILLLARARVGQKSYSVIGQGMIDHMITATPQERKEFFDEATGVKEFQIKRDQAVNKLRRSRENLTQGQAVLAEITPRLRSLKRQVHRLEQREAKEKELREAQRQAYGSLWREIESQTHVERRHLASEEGTLAENERQLADVQALLTHASKEKGNVQAFHELQQDERALLDEKSMLLQKQAVLKSRLETEHERAGGTDLVWLGRRRDHVAKRIAFDREELFRLTKKLKDVDADTLVKRGEQDRIVKTFRELEYKMLRLKESEDGNVHEHLTKRIKKLYAEQEAFLKQLIATTDMQSFKSVKRQAVQLTKEFALLVDELESSTASVARVSELHAVQKELESFSRSRDTVVDELSALQVEQQTMKEKCALIEHEIVQLEKERRDLDHEIDHAEAKNAARSRQDIVRQVEAEHRVLQESIEAFETKLRAVRDKLSDFQREEEKKRKQIFAWQHEAQEVQTNVNHVQSRVNDIRVELARLETRQDDLIEELRHEVPTEFIAEIHAYTGTPEMNHSDLMSRIQKLKHDLELIGGIDPETIAEYEETSQRHEFLSTQTTDLESACDSLEKIIEELDATIRDQFRSTFQKINENFHTHFRMLFEGGHAKLSLIQEVPADETEEQTLASLAHPDENLDETQPEEPRPKLATSRKKKVITGIEIEAQPPGKRLKTPTALSGGEKALTAIALVSAILGANPTPFVVLDEVEAALDEANSLRFAGILEKLARHTQFIVITHNRVTMNASDILYGVTMGLDGVSKVLSVKLEEVSDKVIGK
ncbi:MAG: AAA family ATPase [Candidatus Kerfeldbacteria bacterium]|nr:AAA family ATPase [Candidatus Kerfeldbacteria bacterium]